MLKKKLGNSDLVVSQIGLGTMGMSEFYGKGDDAESIKVIHKAMEKGITFFDTADMYGYGHNEQLLGKALNGKFDQIVLATKFGVKRGPNGEWLGLSGKPEYVKQACDASLKRLGTDTIDLYYLHRVDPETPIEETVGAMAELVQAGKVRYLGLSEVKGETLKKANAVHPITAVQSEYSIWTRDLEDANLDACRELGVYTVAYSPLGRGFLTGKFQTKEDMAKFEARGLAPRFDDENFEHNMGIVRKVEEIAASKGVKPSQIALAWVLARGEDVVPIPGTKREKYLLENIAAVDVSLTSDEIAELDKLSDLVQGTRYQAESMKATLR